MREEYVGYGVFLHGQYLAVTGQMANSIPVAFFQKRAAAVKFRNEEFGDVRPQAKVVKVKVVYEWER